MVLKPPIFYFMTTIQMNIVDQQYKICRMPAAIHICTYDGLATSLSQKSNRH